MTSLAMPKTNFIFSWNLFSEISRITPLSREINSRVGRLRYFFARDTLYNFEIDFNAGCAPCNREIEPQSALGEKRRGVKKMCMREREEDIETESQCCAGYWYLPRRFAKFADGGTSITRQFSESAAMYSADFIFFHPKDNRQYYSPASCPPFLPRILLSLLYAFFFSQFISRCLNVCLDLSTYKWRSFIRLC